MRIWRRTRQAIVSCSVIIVAVGGCNTPIGENHNNNASTGENPTIVDGQAELQSISDDQIVFRMNSGAAPFTNGEIIVGTENGGYLRRVAGTSTDGDGNIVVRTEPVTLVEAVDEGQFGGTVNISPMTESSATIGGTGTMNLAGIELVNGAGIRLAVDSGTAQFTPELTVDVEIEAGAVKSASIVAEGEIDLEALVRLNAESNRSLAGSTELARYSRPFVFGYLAGLATVVIEAKGDASLSAAGNVSTEVNCNSQLRFGAIYDNGAWQRIASESTDFGASAPSFAAQGQATATLSIEPRIEVLLYGIVGPVLEISPAVSALAAVEADSSCSLPQVDWRIEGNLAGTARIDFGMLSDALPEFSTELFDVSEVIASGQIPAEDCDGDPDNDCSSSACDYCYIGTADEGNCPLEWMGTNDGCDCGCQFVDPDCNGGDDGDPVTDCSSSACDYCYIGTADEGNCPLEWMGTNDGCDCGCQFVDPDCGSGGGCSNSCEYAYDGECDDGGPGSVYEVCPYGSDCADCGPR